MSFQETQDEVEVRKEDQDRINEFGILHKSLAEMSQERAKIEEELQYLEDAEQEVMLSSDTSGTFLIQLGATYARVSEDEFNEFLERKKSHWESKLDSIKDEMGNMESRKSELKGVLYARFGKTINLDD